jgi:hypothetical protein
MIAAGYVFQQDFIRAIYDDADDADPALAALTSQPGFKVYRNTVLKASVDALVANYPSIERLVGSEWLRAAALVHARAEPPESVFLIEYGHRFGTFLSSFDAAAELPYLADVARLDRYWTECHIAADETVLDAVMLAAIPYEALLGSVLQVRAAVRWFWCQAHPVYTIWQINRSSAVMGNELVWHGEGALLTRIDGEVCWQAASQGMCAFLDVCAAGGNLHTAVSAALGCEATLDIAALLSSLIQMQVFKAPESLITI